VDSSKIEAKSCVSEGSSDLERHLLRSGRLSWLDYFWEESSRGESEGQLPMIGASMWKTRRCE
jgi:hypothetical protein